VAHSTIRQQIMTVHHHIWLSRVTYNSRHNPATILTSVRHKKIASFSYLNHVKLRSPITVRSFLIKAGHTWALRVAWRRCMRIRQHNGGSVSTSKGAHTAVECTRCASYPIACQEHLAVLTLQWSK